MALLPSVTEFASAAFFVFYNLCMIYQFARMLESCFSQPRIDLIW